MSNVLDEEDDEKKIYNQIKFPSYFQVWQIPLQLEKMESNQSKTLKRKFIIFTILT